MLRGTKVATYPWSAKMKGKPRSAECRIAQDSDDWRKPCMMNTTGFLAFESSLKRP